MSQDFLLQAVIYLLAAIISVPIAKRLGLGSVLGYLIAGTIIGPSALHLVGEVEDVQHFAEFGVVIMLFVVGLELRPSLLWRLRGPILGMGGLQVLVTAAVIAGCCLVFSQSWPVGLTIGLTLAMSSTAIVLQSLTERGLLNGRGGQACFAVLLFQDIAVIPILALMPWLARAAGGKPVAAAHASALSGLPPWAQALAALGAVVAVVFISHRLLRYVFRFVAASGLREMFTAVALLVVAGVAGLMHLVGLSAALGTFIAGVVLAESEYRHQLEADVEPFKGLLLGLFFIAVGAGLDLGLVVAEPLKIAGLVLGLMLAKFLLLLGIGGLFKLGWAASLLFACALAQGGEFCFVLISMAGQLGVFTDAIAQPLKAAVALSMALTPLLLVFNDRLLQPRFAAKPSKSREPDAVESHDNPVVLAGFGRFGHIVGRLLRANGFGVTVLDSDPDQIESLARFGIKSYYGDASRPDLLAAAGAAKARLFICAVDNTEKSLQIVDLVRHEFPNLQILARATSRAHAYELIRRGVHLFQRDTLGSAIHLSVDALQALGFPEERAVRAGLIFHEHEQRSVREMAAHYGTDEEKYVSVARQHIQALEAVLHADQRDHPSKPAEAPDSAKPH